MKFQQMRGLTGGLALLLAALVLCGCGAQMRNLPLGKGNVQVSASLGGPLVRAMNTTIPVPYGMAGATYGLSDRTEVFTDVHILAAVYKFLGLTPGIVYFPKLPLGRWTPSIGADVLVFSDLHEARGYPELVTTICRPIGTRWAPYAGMKHTFQAGRGPHYIPSAFAGTSLRMGRSQLFAEVQWLALESDNRFTPVDYSGVGNRGAISLQLGYALDFARKGGSR